MGSRSHIAAEVIIVDVIVPDARVAREHDARIVGSNVVVFDRPVIRQRAESLNGTPYVADDEIADRYVVDVLIVSSERRVDVVGRRPSGTVQDRAVLANEGIPRLRDDRLVHVMYADLEAKRGRAGKIIDLGLNQLNGIGRQDVDGARGAGNRRLRTHPGGWWRRRISDRHRKAAAGGLRRLRTVLCGDLHCRRPDLKAATR